MLQRGDYVVPYLNNQYRFDKPPLTYWCQTVSYRVFGDNDFAARLPSAIAASFTALLLFAWGRRIGVDMGQYRAWAGLNDQVLERPAVQRVLEAEGLKAEEFRPA